MWAITSFFITVIVVFGVLGIVVFFDEPITELLYAKADELRARAEAIKKENKHEQEE